MANNDDKRIYDSLANWLQDCFDDIKGHDDLNRFKKLGFDQELKNGKEWAESKKTLSKINNFFANNFGAYPTIVPMRNNEGWRIVYKPSNANELGLREDQWPSLEIEMSKDGATIHNTMWSPETAAYIRGKNGQVGLTSLPNAALRQVLNDLEAQEPSIKNVMNRNKKEGFQYLKSTVSGSIRDIKNLSPAIYSPNQLKEYDKLNQGNLKRKRLESTEAMKTMADYSNYVRSVYKSLDSKVKFQKTEKEFTRMVDDIITYSRYVKDITELQQVVQQNYNYIYKNAWFGELENFYKSIVGKVKQGTMTEGSVGKIMFSEPDVIASNFAKAGKKIGQNLQVFEQFSHFGKNVPTVARGRSNAFTKTQYAKIKEKIKSGEMDKDSVYKDLYEVAYISDLSLKKAYEEIAAAKKSNYDPAKLSDTYKRIFGTRKLNDKEFKAIQQAALKGFGNDAILISEGLADEFKEIKEFKRYKDNVVDFEEANEAIRKKLIKDRMNRIHSVKAPDKLKGKRLDEYTNYVKELEDLKKGKSIFELTANGSVKYNFKDAESEIYRYLKKAYDLDSLSWIDGFNIDNGKFVDVVGHRKMDHHNFVARAGASGDVRALAQKSYNDLLAYSMALSGYGDSDIWTGTGKNRTLRPAIFQDSTQELKDSNARTMFMQQFHRVMSYIDQNLEKVNKSVKDKKLGDDINSYLKKDKLIGRFISFDGEKFLFDQEEFFKKYDSTNTGKRQKNIYNITGAIQGLVQIGKDIGLLATDMQYFSTEELNGKKYLVQQSPLLGMTEFGESSTDQYGGLGKETHSGFKLDWKAVSAMKGTLGNYEKFINDDLDKGDKSQFRKDGESREQAFERLVKPIKNMVAANEQKLEEKKKEWEYYTANAERLKLTFTNQGKERQEALRKQTGFFAITIDDILKLYTDRVDWGTAEGADTGEFLGQNFFRTANDNKITKESSQQDIKNKLNPFTRITIYAENARKMEYRRLKKIYGEQQLKEWGILGPESIQPFLDLGDDRYIANFDGQIKSTSAIPLALGSYDKKAAEKGIFMPDKVAGYTEDLVRTIAQIYSPATVDKLKAKNNAAYKVDDYLRKVQDEYNTNIYDKTHTVTNYNESGYLRLAALSDFSETIFGDLAENIQGLDNKGKNNLRSVQRILSTTDFAAMASEMYKTDEGRKELFKLFEVTTGKKWKGKGKDKFIQNLTDLFDISKEGYKGYTFSGGGQLRNPIIKFMDDLSGGKTVLTSDSNLVGVGTMAINKHLAAAGKGDMDGDMVAFMYAFAAGDLEGAQEALDKYFLDLQDTQKDADQVSKKVEKAAATRQALGEKLGLSPDAVEMMMRFGETSKINDPANSTHKKMTVASMWFNKKGAGIFGNEAFEAQKVLEYLGVDASNNGINDRILQLGGSLFSALTQTLYQEGISAKKAGPGALLKAASIHTMGNQARTWDDEDQLRTFLQYLKDLDIIDAKGMFKDNSLQKIGLGSLSKDEETLKELKKTLTEQKKRLAKRFGSASSQVRNIKRDLDAIDEILTTGNGSLKNVSEEMFIAMMRLFNSQVTSGTEHSLGQLIKDAPYRIFNNEVKGLNKVSDQKYELGEEEKKLIENANKKNSDIFKTRNQQILEADELFIGPRVTSRAKLMIEDNGKEIPMDLFSITQAMKEYAELDPNNEKHIDKLRELEKFRNENYANIIKNNLTPFKAVTGGTIAHKAAELMHLGFTAKNKDIFNGQRNYTPESVYKYFGENYGDLLENYRRQYKYFLPDAKDDEINELIMSSLFKGVGNYEYVHDTVAGRGGQILGVELPLATFSNPENKYMAIGQGTSDIISFYRELDEKNPNKIISHLDIGDYKNTSHGQLEAENVFQGLDYRQSIIDMFQDIEAKGGIGKIGDFDAYLSQGEFTPDDMKDDATLLKRFHNSENNVINAILWRLHNDALELSDNAEVGSKKYDEAYKIAKQKYKELYDKSGEVSPEDIGIRFYSHGADGFINEYLITMNSELKELFEKEKATFFKSGNGLPRYDWGGYHASEPIQTLLNKSAKVVGSRFIGSDEEADKLFRGKLFYAQKAYTRLRNDKASLAIKQKELDALKREDITPENQKRKQDLEKEIEDLNKKIGTEINPEDAGDKVKDIDTEIGELSKILADKEKTEAEKEIAKDRIAELTEQREEISKSDYFKLALARDSLRREKINTSAERIKDEDKGFISGKSYDDVLNDQYKKIEEEEINKAAAEAEQRLAERALIKHAKEYKSLSLSSARANAQKGSKILTEAERDFVDEQAQELVLDLQNKREAIESEIAIVGKERAAELIGKDFDTATLDELNKGKAEREVGVLDRQKIASLETKIYEFYLGQFKLQDQIAKYDEQIAKAQEEDNEILAKVLQGKKVNAEKIMEIQAESAKSQLKDIPGWTQAIEDAQKERAKNQVELDRKIEEDAKRAIPRQGQGGGAGGPGFLGIDAHTARWLSRIMQGGGLAAFIRLIKRGFKDLTNKAKQLDQAMTNLRIVTGKNVENARTLINGYAELGKELGATTLEVTNAAQAWLRQGYDIAQVNDLVTASLYLSKLGMIDTATATQNLTSAMHGFKLEASEAMDIVDKLTALDVKAATTAGDIAQGLSQFANIASLGGVSIDQAAAYVATIADVNQMSGITVGQSLNFYGDLRG